MTDLFRSTRRVVTPTAPAVSPAAPIELSSKVDLPPLPLCAEHIRAALDSPSIWFGCTTLFKELGNHSSQIYLGHKVEKCAEKLAAKRLPLTHEWNPESQRWYPLAAPQEDWAVEQKGLKDFVVWAMARTRKPKDEKLRLIKKLVADLDAVETDKIKGPVENELLSVLSQCIPFKVEFQYRIGKYRVDAFVPRLRLAIQIDEHGHRGYDPAEEREYDEAVRDSNIVCIRFNPHQKYAIPAEYELVRIIWERTLSPDFTAFREKLVL